MRPTTDLTYLATDDVSRRRWQQDELRVPQKLTEATSKVGGRPRLVLSTIDQRFLLNKLKAGTQQRFIAVELSHRRFARLSPAERRDAARVRESEVSAPWLSKHIAKMKLGE